MNLPPAFSRMFAALFLFASVIRASSGPSSCELYPLALCAQTLRGVQPGQSVNDIFNGVQPGNFGWLAWAGSPGEPALLKSLTSPGDSSTYSNPENPADHEISVGDWISGKPGVSNTKTLRDALEALKEIDLVVPVWDQSRGQGAKSAYRVAAFARIRLLSYQLPGQNRIAARFLGYVACGIQNRPPIATSAGLELDEDTSAPVVLTGSDPDGDVLRFTVLSVPMHGTLSGTPPNLLYSPLANYNGADSFTFKASDGQLDSGPAVVAISVISVNDPPVVDAGPDQLISWPRNSVVLSGAVTDDYFDGFSPAISWSKVSGPGTVIFNQADSPRASATFGLPGVYLLELAASDSGFTSIDDVVVTVNAPPTVDAGPDQTVTNLQVVLHGTAVDDGLPVGAFTVGWTVVSGPGTVTFASPTSPVTLATFSQRGVYQLRLTADDTLAQPTDDIVISIDSPPTVNAGADQVLTFPAPATLAAVATDDQLPVDVPLKYSWSKINGPGEVHFTATNTLSTLATFSQPGVYVLQFVADDSLLSASDEVTIVVNQSPVVSAGTNQLINFGQTCVLSGIISDDGLPVGTLTATWSVLGGPGAVVFADAGNARSSVSFSASGIYSLRLTATDSQAITSSDVTIFVNGPPAVNAGDDQIVTLPDGAPLAGTASDDGVPPGIPLAIAWSKISGPGTVSFSEPHTSRTKATFNQAGTYLLRLFASDSLSSVSDDVTVTVLATNRAPTVTAGTNQTVRLPATALLAGTVTDDELPTGRTLLVNWSQVNGPTNAFISDPLSPTSSVSFSTNGTYVFRLTANDSQFTTTQDVTITVLPPVVNQPPVVSAGSNLTVGLVNSVILQGSVYYDGLPAGSKFSATWSRVSGPGLVTFSDSTSPGTTATFGQAGSYVLRLTATDTQFTNHADVTISIYPNNQPPVVNAGPDQLVVLPTVIVGTNGTNSTFKLTAVSTGFNNPVGVDYYPPANQLILSVNYPTGLPYNFELVDQNGSRTPFSNISGLGDETYMATVRDDGAGFGLGGFPAGEMFTGNGASGVIVRISSDGITVQNPWVTLPGESGLLRGSLHVDRTGVFGGDLIVGTTSGGIWRINSAGQASRLANVATLIEGLTTIPNDTAKYGPWAGKVLAGGEESGLLYAVSPSGSVQSFNLGIPPEAIHVIPANENFYGVDFAGKTLWGAPADAFKNMIGDILIARETPGDLWHVRWTGTNFFSEKLVTVNQWEGSSFAPQGILEIPDPQTPLLSASIQDDGLPATGVLKSLWTQVSGPAPATFANSNAPVTSVFFSATGTYVLRLTADDSELISSDDITVVVKRNQAPIVDAGPDQTVSFPGIVQLTGLASDDGLPAGASLNVSWSVVSGPGAVTFNQPNDDAARDFSIDLNPHDAWSYGWITNRGAPFVYFTERRLQEGGLDKWLLNGNFPVIYYNYTTQAVSVGSYNLPSGALLLHPGPANQSSVVRWTASESGSYLIQGNFTGLDPTVTSDASILWNSSTILASGFINARGQQVFFSLVKQLNAGDTIDFSVGAGSNNNYDHDGTSLTASITKTAGPSVTAAFSAPGAYVLRFTANDGELAASDLTTVTVNPVCIPPPPGLFGRWNGDSNANDSINGNDGVLLLGANFAPGEIGAAFNFDGVNDGVKIPTSPTPGLSTGSGLTIECWIKPADLNPSHPIVEWNNSYTSGAHFWIYPGVGTLFANLVDVNGVGHSLNTPTSVLITNAFQHVGVTYDKASGVARIYCNGIIVLEQNLGSFTPQTSYPLYLGCRPFANFFKGQIDDVSLYNRALTPAEMFSIYAAQSAGKCQDPTPFHLAFVATEQFSKSNNPAGSWTYGYKTNIDSVFISYSVTNADANIDVWLPAGLSYPRIAANKTGTGITIFGSINFPPDELLLHPGQKGELSDLRWTCPSNGVYRIHAVFEGLDPTTTDVHVRLNSTSELFTNNINARAEVKSFVFTQNLFTGNTVEFLVGYGLNHTFDYDSTGLRVWIETVDGTPANQPPNVSAGNDASIFQTSTLNLNGTVADDGFPVGSRLTAAWSKISGPGTVSFGNSSLPTSTATFSLPGIYLLRLTATDSIFSRSDDVVVQVVAASAANHAPSVNAGGTITLHSTTATLDGVFSDDGLPLNSRFSATWTKISGSGTVASSPVSIFPDDLQPGLYHATAPVTFSSGGSYVFRLSVSDSLLTSTNDLVLNVALNQRPVVFAGTDKIIAPSVPLTLNGTVFDDNLPEGGVISTHWSQISGPGVVTFSNPDQPITTASFSAIGKYLLRLSASDSALSGSDDVLITISALPNQPPAVNAGSDQLISLPNPAILTTAVSDDGLPARILETKWSVLSGPGPVTFANINGTYQASFYQTGQYVLRLTATDTQFTNSDDVLITVTPNNSAPTVNAGRDLTIILPDSATLAGSVTDDGVPGILTIAWTKISGPGLVTFNNPAAPAAIAQFSAPGTYLLRLTASDSFLASHDDVQVKVYPVGTANLPPSVNAGSDQTIRTPNNQINLSGSISDDDLPVGSVLTASWSKISGPGTVTFDDPASPSTVARFSSPGTYYLRLSASDSQYTNTDVCAVHIYNAVTSPPPTVELLSPPDGQHVTSQTSITGNVSAGDWILEYRFGAEDEDNLASPWILLASGSGPVTQATLGLFDPTILLNGVYTIRLTALDASGQLASDTSTLVVDRKKKVGHFTMSFADLNVPVAGIPIEVVRTYDSRDRRIGDFGVGWTLALNNIHLQKNRSLGAKWTQTSTGGGFAFYCLDPGKPRLVTITFPGDKMFKFQAVITPECQLGYPLASVTVDFVPVDDTRGKLEIVGDNNPDIDGFLGQVNLIDFNGFTTFNPRLFKFTTQEGDVYIIDERLGLQSMTDRNGNTLTVTRDGIIHSSGKSVLFQRNASGVITNIIDPAGNAISYQYDDANHLLSCVDRENLTNSFTYINDSYLFTITDARGRQPLRNEYDDSGRLVRQIDATGHTNLFAHDLSNNREIITDRVGHTTVHEYDDDGNVVRITDALGAVTTMRYDANDNLIEQVDSLGRTNRFTYDSQNNRTSTTDPLGNVSFFTYNSHRQATSMVDPRGNSVTNAYDDGGNLTSMRDPLGNVSRFGYRNGLLTAHTNAAGETTLFAYDQFGFLTNHIDALGHSTSFSRDANGNILTQTTSRSTPAGLETLVTRFTYDSQNRLTNTVFADGSTSSVRFNALGKTAAATDALGRVTSFEYDDQGRATRTIFADGSSIAASYDLEGLLIAATNQAGQVTFFFYDAVGRRIRTQFADGSSVSNYFDAAGQLADVTDARGFSTFYGYDNAGRTISVTNALGQITRSEYDPAGNLIAAIDALNRTNRFVYDSLNRRIRSVFNDRSTIVTIFDSLGRKTADIDQNGRATTFGYDLLGRLTSVTNALGDVTRFSYNELGQQIQQIDANNHLTSFQYDVVGRRIARTLPGAQSETYAYDPAGNLTNRTDFNGYLTTFIYDTMNRLTAKVPDVRRGEPSTIFGYNCLGLRTNMIDASGSSSYEYDARNRLAARITTLRARPSYPAISYSLHYAHDANANVTNIHSSNANGTEVNYAYDPLNRLEEVNDARVGRTVYAYDDVGNLRGFTHPNGVNSYFQYDALNRLTNLHGSALIATIADFRYSLDPAGHRVSATEFITASGLPRTINHLYRYDATYKLTNELINVAGQPSSLDYAYDRVGNRLNRTSQSPALPNQSFFYDSNDRLSSDQYDANGNTLVGHDSFGTSFGSDQYDFESRLTRRTDGGRSISIVYDGDGQRVAKTITSATATITTLFVVDGINPTGYAQVLEELTTSSPILTPQVRSVYTWGHALLSQDQFVGNQWQSSFYDADGHGNIRYLTDSTGQITDTFDYDAFGNLLNRTGATPNNYLYCGEQFDPDLKLYYLRARYANPDTGRFWSADAFEGFGEDPSSLHKYIYCANDPVNAIDPSGNYSLTEATVTMTIANVINNLALRAGLDTLGQAFEFIPNQGGHANEVYAAIETLNEILLIYDSYNIYSVSRAGGAAGAWLIDKAQAAVTKLAKLSSKQWLGIKLLAPKSVAQAAPRAEKAIEGIENGAAETTAARNPNVYEALFESPIRGTSRSAHRASANEFLANQLRSDSQLNGMLNQELGGNVLQHMESGSGLLNPPGTVWHHPFDNPNIMQLLRTGEHTAPSLQPVLHPGGVGGFGNFYGP